MRAKTRGSFPVMSRSNTCAHNVISRARVKVKGLIYPALVGGMVDLLKIPRGDIHGVGHLPWALAGQVRVSRRALERVAAENKHHRLHWHWCFVYGSTAMGESAAAGQRCGQRRAILRDDGAHVPASMLYAAGVAPQAHLCHLQAPRRPLSRRPRRQAPHVDRSDARSRRQAAAWTHWAPRYSDKWPDSCQRGPFDAQRHVRAPQTVHPLALRSGASRARAHTRPSHGHFFLLSPSLPFT